MKWLHALAWIVAVLGLLAFGYVQTAPPAEDPFTAYSEALTRLAATKPPAPGSESEAAALARLEGFFANITPENVREHTRHVYAEQAMLSDTLAIVRGRDAIEAYYRKSAQGADAIAVEFTDIVRSGDDFYLRWSMRIEHPAFNEGAPMVSMGMSHMRLDADGRIALHFDYWDSGAGFFEHVPVASGVLRRIREQLH
ncbi:MAG: nuclear transport factor 2 family protein [Pseudomonadota bacterium]